MSDCTSLKSPYLRAFLISSGRWLAVNPGSIALDRYSMLFVLELLDYADQGVERDENGFG
ncbi:hypothetical protein [Paralcaligenes ginsengisoli]